MIHMLHLHAFHVVREHRLLSLHAPILIPLFHNNTVTDVKREKLIEHRKEEVEVYLNERNKHHWKDHFGPIHPKSTFFCQPQ
jgi:glutamate formiminotransferase